MATFTESDALALQALEKGEASPEQQVRALRHILEEICKVYYLSYDYKSDRHTAFREGRRAVALEIISILRTNTEALKEKDNGRRRADTRHCS